MDFQQILLSLLLVTLLLLFLYERWRYDVVAISGLVAAVFLGLVDPEKAFEGFSHPSIITVAAVFVISRALQNVGFVDCAINFLSNFGGSFTSKFFLLNFSAMVVSALINNIGALAIFLPVGLALARSSKVSPSLIFMPLAFSTLIGGMTTMIGTPSNIVVALMRKEHGLEAFSMFSFAPVGLSVSMGGILFLSFYSHWFLHKRKPILSLEPIIDISAYATEIKILEGSDLIGKSLSKFQESTQGSAVVFEIFRKNKKVRLIGKQEKIQAEDILVISSDHETLKKILINPHIEMLLDTKSSYEEILKEGEIVQEMVLGPRSPLVGKIAGSINLRKGFSVNIIAVSPARKRRTKRLSKITLGVGDVLLLRGSVGDIQEFIQTSRGFLLEEQLPQQIHPKKMLLTLGAFAAEVLCISLQWISPQIAFTSAILVMHLGGILRVGEIYESIEFPILILLGAMMPLGHAFETTGAATNLVDYILMISPFSSPLFYLAFALIGSMLLSAVINNIAAVILMVPIGIKLSTLLAVSPDPFLMAVAVGGACPFLTPVGHQCNMLVLGPGGYRFSDYWKLGLPLEFIIIVLSLLLIPVVWPF